MRGTATVNAEGRITLPASIRRELGIEPGATLIVETEAGRIVLRPATLVPAEDAWAYTPEHRARHAAAVASAAAGRVVQLSEDELRARIGLPAAADDEPADADDVADR
jgi:AbrB family looped-hinge helix DNA binding protein